MLSFKRTLASSRAGAALSRSSPAADPSIPASSRPTSITSHQRRLFHQSSTRRAHHEEQNHYKVLGVPASATKKEIRERFYELSRKYHPDAPSTSSNSSIQDRTARFQSISQSWAILSDDSLRKQYDASLSGYGGSYGTRPTYSTSAPHSSGRHSGFGGGSAAAWSSTYNSANAQRRERANYAWAHPTRNRGPTAEQNAKGRADPFSKVQDGPRSHGELYNSYWQRDNKARERAEASGAMGGYGSATAAFGAKAEEESRLINDSSFMRSGQVFLLFGLAFAVSMMFSSRKHDDKDLKKRRQ